jgi:hypothetical protein
MGPLQRLFADSQSFRALPPEVESAVNEVLKEAEELCSLLRHRRDATKALTGTESG